jgi:hypothetical protein
LKPARAWRLKPPRSFRERAKVPLEIDHVIVCCDVGAPQAEALVDAGVLEGSGNVHAGQGSANRRFFFQNAYLELLWIDDLAQAKREPARRTRLWERWQRRGEGASPFGIALRPSDLQTGERPPFPTWAYHAPYLPANVAIGIALNTPLSEPEFLHIAFATQPGAKRREPLQHPVGLSRLTGVRIGGPHGDGVRSQAAKAVAAGGLVAFFEAPDHVMELVFDDGTRERRVDVRPALPLIVRS